MMTDSMVAQREARRQKLLKNAESRMNRLRARPQSESDDMPSPDIELQKVEQHLEAGNEKRDSEQNDELRTTSHYNLRHRTRQGLSNSTDGVRELSPSENKSSSVPYEIVDDPEVPSLAEFLAKQEASKPTNLNRQQSFNPNVHMLPPKSAGKSLQTQTKQVEYVRVFGLFITALLSRLILPYEFGTDVFLLGTLFKSMFFPLMLFEVLISFAIHRYMPGVSTASAQGSILTTALMLCGIKPELIQLYIKIMARVTVVSNDLFLYIFAFLLWHVTLGL